MSRSLKLLSATFAAGAIILATAGPADAQFFYRQSPTIYSRFPFGTVTLPFGYGVLPAYGLGINTAGAVFPSPIGPYGFVSRRLYYAPMYYPAYPGVPTVYASIGSYSNSLAARERYYLMRAQGLAGYGRGGVVNPAAYTREASAPAAKPADPDAWKDAPDALRQALLNPSDQAIASGLSLNELIKAVPELESRSGRADTPFLAPRVLDKLTFTGGPAADVLNLVRAGHIDFPAALQAPEFDKPRTAVENDLTAAIEQLRAGKRIEPNLPDRLNGNLKAMKARAGTDAAATLFLGRLEDVARFLKSPNADGLYDRAWQFDGSTLTDLARHMAKYKLQFGPAAAGNEEVYAAVHRGMAGYLNQLTQVKR